MRTRTILGCVSASPIGVFGRENQLAVLPVYVYSDSGRLTFASKATDLAVPPAGSITVHYDWADINFTEILVRTDQWTKVLIVDPAPSRNGYGPPKKNLFVIDRTTRLAPASPEVLLAVDDAQGRAWRRRALMWLVFLPGIIAPLALAYCVVRYLGTKSAKDRKRQCSSVQ